MSAAARISAPSGKFGGYQQASPAGARLSAYPDKLRHGRSALEFFAWGAASWVCAGSNFAPEAHIALWKTCVVEGDFTLGRKIMSAMLPLMRTLEQAGFRNASNMAAPSAACRRPARRCGT